MGQVRCFNSCAFLSYLAPLYLLMQVGYIMEGVLDYLDTALDKVLDKIIP